MNCEDYKNWIQEFHDKELDKGKEPLLFIHLSQCSDCREFFKNMSSLNLIAQSENISFPIELDKRIMLSIDNKISHASSNIFMRRVPAYVSYLLGIIILMMAFYLFDSTKEYKNELREAVSTMKEQNQRLQLIMNSYPEIEVKSSYPYKVIVQ